ncbi:putative E3 ubiquitin-protein ligase XBAT35, partial [Mucuna pruriens]
ASPGFLQNNVATSPPIAPPTVEDTELAMSISASLQSAMQKRPPFPDAQPNFEASSSSTAMNTGNHGFWAHQIQIQLVHEANLGGKSQHLQSHVNDSDFAGLTASGLDFNPSTLPIVDGPIHYPSIDSSPVDMTSPNVEKLPKEEEKNASANNSSCMICLDAPAKGACIPYGHVAGCMSCLNEVKAKKWGCPVCRAKIVQVIKLYH